MSGPFGKPLFGKPAVAPIGDAAAEASLTKTPTVSSTTAVRKFNFKQSALSSVADNMWNKSKSVFTTDQKSTPVHLEKKSLNDVLGKMSSATRDKSEAEAPSFVFGSKIKEKVTGDLPAESSGECATVAADEAAAKIMSPKSSLAAETTADAASKFREDSAHVAEALKKEQEKHLASTSVVDVTTGEEDDHNIMQAACKLHAYDKEKKKWVERGLCNVRINRRTEEDGQVHYRIVARSTGNQRVVINSKMFADMFLERVDTKRIKLSAMGADLPTPQIFLLTISFSKTDLTADALYKTLSECLIKEKGAETRKRRADEGAGLPLAMTKKERMEADSSTADDNESKDDTNGSQQSSTESPPGEEVTSSNADEPEAEDGKSSSNSTDSKNEDCAAVDSGEQEAAESNA